MKLVFGFVCALFYSFMSFGQITQWTDINYANDSLEGHKLDIYLPDGGQTEYKVVVLKPLSISITSRIAESSTISRWLLMKE